MHAVPTVDAHGARIPAIGLGTWPMTGADCAAAVAAALRCGYRHIDTAQMYANEEAVGDGLRDGGVARDELFLTTKIWRDNLTADRALRATEASLKRLRVDAVDLLLIHWPERALTAAQMVDALRACRDAGMTRHIGVSNFPVALMDAAMAAALRDGGAPLVANQCERHPALDQSRVIAACRRHGMAFVSYSPLGKGALLDAPVIDAIARAHRRPPGTVVLRWHVQKPGVVAIPKSQTPERIRANGAVFDFSLSDAEMKAIDSLARPDGRQIAPEWGPDWDAA